MLLGFMSKYKLLDQIMEREFSVIKLRKMNINSSTKEGQACKGFLEDSWRNHNFFIFFVFLGMHPWHTEVPRLGVESELQPLVYATATAMLDLSWVCDPHNSSWQCQII